MRSALFPAAALAIGVAAGPALAAPGFATGNVNLRAGPGTSYPKVVVVPNGAPVEVFGCLQGYSWCDVGFGGTRGWVSSNYLQYEYEARRVPLPRYAPQSGVPIIGFSFGDYWRDNYRGRSWYTERDRWGGPPPPPRAAYGGPPPPPGGPGWDRGPGWRPDRGPEGRADWHDERRGPPGEWRRDGGGGPPGEWRGGPPGEGRGGAPGEWRREGRGGPPDGGRGGPPGRGEPVRAEDGRSGPGPGGPGERGGPGPGDRGPGDRGPGDRGPGDRGPGDRGPGGPPGLRPN